MFDWGGGPWEVCPYAQALNNEWLQWCGLGYRRLGSCASSNQEAQPVVCETGFEQLYLHAKRAGNSCGRAFLGCI